MFKIAQVWGPKLATPKINNLKYVTKRILAKVRGSCHKQITSNLCLNALRFLGVTTERKKAPRSQSCDTKPAILQKMGEILKVNHSREPADVK